MRSQQQKYRLPRAGQSLTHLLPLTVTGALNSPLALPRAGADGGWPAGAGAAPGDTSARLSTTAESGVAGSRSDVGAALGDSGGAGAGTCLRGRPGGFRLRGSLSTAAVDRARLALAAICCGLICNSGQ